MSEYAIEVNNVSKKFKIYFDKGYSLRDKLLFWKRNRYEELKVLQNVSFSIKKGEAVGLIGHNGCGKSTTLKMLTRIMYPDSGKITMNGRVSSLLELGAGFHPDMSGLENIYINASIFGLSKKEINKRLKDIIEFAEIGDFLNNPVRTYSSGMYARLAFAVAINVDADILLIDEVLAVGDAKFRDKCLKKLKEIKEQGTTIVLVSHSLGQIESFCNRTIWLHNGQICKDGTPKEVHKEYLDFMNGKPITSPTITYPIKFTKSKFLDKNNNEITSLTTGSSLKLDISYEVDSQIVGKDPVFTIRIFNKDNVYCYGTNTIMDKTETKPLEKEGKISIVLSNLWLISGKYRFDFVIKNNNMQDISPVLKRNIEITSKNSRPGIIPAYVDWVI